jgi:RHS repeat-associated protein
MFMNDLETIAGSGTHCGLKDEQTHLAHFRNRDYATSLGRWVQKDPAGFVDGSSLYAYVRSNPRSNVDPLGLQASPAAQGSPEREAEIRAEMERAKRDGDAAMKRYEDLQDAVGLLLFGPLGALSGCDRKPSNPQAMRRGRTPIKMEQDARWEDALNLLKTNQLSAVEKEMRDKIGLKTVQENRESDLCGLTVYGDDVTISTKSPELNASDIAMQLLGEYQRLGSGIKTNDNGVDKGKKNGQLAAFEARLTAQGRPPKRVNYWRHP